MNILTDSPKAVCNMDVYSQVVVIIFSGLQIAWVWGGRAWLFGFFIIILNICPQYKN